MSPAPCLVAPIGSEDGPPLRGVFLGVATDEHGELCCVVAIDGHGMMLRLVHPSRVTLEGCVCG